MLFGGLPRSASDAHDMVSQIFEALEKPVTEVKALRDTTCQLQLFRRTHLVEVSFGYQPRARQCNSLR